MSQNPLRRILPVLLAACAFGSGLASFSFGFDLFDGAARAQTAPASSLPTLACLEIPNAVRLGSATQLTATTAWRQYQLTPATTYSVGAVWAGARADLSKHFSAAAWVYLGARSGSGGGDGLAFLLQNDPRGTAALGPDGHGHGASDSHSSGSAPVVRPGIRRSLAVEFDSYQNLGAGTAGWLSDPQLDWRDPAEDHVALILDGDGRHTNPAFPTPYLVPGGLKDGRYHHFRFSWDPTAQKFQIYLNYKLAQEHVLSDPLGHFGGAQPLWGYAAGTAGAYNSQRVCHLEAPAPPRADYGDAPASYGQAWHMRPTHLQQIHMGYVETAYPNTEAASLSHATALGDAQEDPFIGNLPNWSGGYVPLRGWGGGYLNAWIDWNRDGVFSAAEQVVKDVRDEDPEDLIQGSGGYMQVYAAPRPDLMTGGEGLTFLRMRWSSQPGLGPTGEAPDGEVEDHAFMLVRPKEHLCAATSDKPFATGGTGRHQGEIFWLDWSCSGAAQFNAGDVATKTWTLPGGQRLTGRLHEIRGSIRPYQMGGANESLNRLYQGLGWPGLSSRYLNSQGNSPHVAFKLSLSLQEPDGTPVPYRLTTVATEAENLTTGESLRLSLEGGIGEPWRPIDFEGLPSAAYLDGGRTALIQTQGSPGGLILASAGGAEIQATVGPGPASASVAAFGVFIGSDYGDAPASYGAAGHVQEIRFSGGSQPEASTRVTEADLAIREPSPLRMGARVDVEAAPLHGAEAQGDDLSPASGPSDEDALAEVSRRDSQGSPLFDALQDTLLSIPVSGAGHLRGWIDWNGDGVFSAAELVAADLQDGGPGDLDPAPGVVRFAVRAPAEAPEGRSFLRLRWSARPGVGPAAHVAQGEAEDHRVMVLRPADVSLSLSASDLQPLLGHPMSFDLTARNDGPHPARDLVVWGALPEGYVFLKAEPSQGLYDPASGFWAIGAIPAGESRMLRLTAAPLAKGPWAYVAEAFSHSHVDPDSTPNNGLAAEDDYAALAPEPHRGLGESPEALACSGEAESFVWSAEALSDGFAFAGSSASLRVSGAQQTGWPRLQGSDLELAGAAEAFVEIAFSRPVSGLRLEIRGLGASGEALERATVSGSRGGGRIPARLAGGAALSLQDQTAVGVLNPGADPEAGLLRIAFDQPADLLRLEFGLIGGGGGALWRAALGSLGACAPSAGEAIRLTPNHDSTVPPGQLAIYAHRLLLAPAYDGAALSFEAISDQGLGWVLHLDDGDGIFNAAQDPPWSPGSALAAGSHGFWAVARIPHGVPASWRDRTLLRARIAHGALSLSAEVEDVTRTGGAAEGQLQARKSLSLDVDCDGRPDPGAAFHTELPIAAGGCALYRIAFANLGVEPISRLRVQDHTPDWSLYLGDSAQTLILPPGLTEAGLSHPAPGEAGPLAFAFEGELQPGEGGMIQFGIRLMGGAVSAGPIKPN